MQGDSLLAAKAQEIATQAASNLQLADVAAEVASGSISKLSTAHQVAAIHAQTYADKLKELNAELAELQANTKRGPITGAVSDPKQAAQIQGVQNQISQTQGQACVSSIQNQQAQVQAAMQPWETAIGKGPNPISEWCRAAIRLSQSYRLTANA